MQHTVRRSERDHGSLGIAFLIYFVLHSLGVGNHCVDHAFTLANQIELVAILYQGLQLKTQVTFVLPGGRWSSQK